MKVNKDNNKEKKKFLSHLSGDEVINLFAAVSVSFLSHLSGDEVLDS